MKVCTKCGENRDYKKFNRRGQKLSSWCKLCISLHHKKVYKDSEGKLKKKLSQQEESRLLITRNKVADYLKSHPCADCGESNILVLDFDHIGVKSFEIGHALWRRYSWKRIEAEVKQCQVLCANCHRIKTTSQLKSWKLAYV